MTCLSEPRLSRTPAYVEGDVSKIPLQIIGAGPAGMGLVLALCNRIAAADGKALQEQHMLDALQMFEAGVSPGGNMGHYFGQCQYQCP